MAKKTKIVLDSDVIIHFLKADRLFTLINIFPEYQYIVLDVVYNELNKHPQTKNAIDNFTHHFANRISIVTFNPKGESMREYAKLQQMLGKGESASMVYCRDNQDVLGSSNLRDIKEYCEANGITYLTTLDFLYYAFVRHQMTARDCENFISTVNYKGSKLPVVKIETYICSVQI